MGGQGKDKGKKKHVVESCRKCLFSVRSKADPTQELKFQEKGYLVSSIL